jgi:hypothetical protein
VGCKKLQEVGVTKILLEGMGKPDAAAEGATLGLWLYQEFKNKIKQKKTPQLEFYGEESIEERYIGFFCFLNPILLEEFSIFAITMEHISYESTCSEQICVLTISSMLICLCVVSENSWLNSESDPKRFYICLAK